MKKYFIRLCFTCCIVLFNSFPLFSQSVLNRTLDGSEKGKSLQALLKEIETKDSVHFFYLENWIENISFTDSYTGHTFSEALTDLFLGTDLSFVEMNDHAIVIIKDPAGAIQRNVILQSAIREQKKIEKVTIGIATDAKRNQTIELTGKVSDSKNKGTLTGTSIYVTDLNISTTSDVNGEYKLTLPSGKHIISFTFVNYDEKIVDLEIYKTGALDLIMEEAPTLLEEVVVSGAANQDFNSTRIGQTQLNIREIKRAPALLGEVDLIKQIQVLPGVTTAGEAASGFNVRGGGVDQNLILYDGVPVFNSSHAFGFFSTFNADAIRDVSFYRGGIPAEYGGRVSSILNIRSKEGSYEKWGGNGGVGMVSSNLSFNGPIKKDKTSLVASFRTTYSNWLINTIRTNYVDLRNSSVSFYDGSLKLAHKFSDKTKLTASAYMSHDQFRLTGDSTYTWDNLLGAIQLDHEFSPRFFMQASLGYGSYQYQLQYYNALANSFDLSYKMAYPNGKVDFHYQYGIHKVAFGAQSLWYGFDPGKIEPTSQASNIKSITLDRQRSIENAIYFSDALTWREKYILEVGARISSFIAIGPADVNIYKPGVPRQTNTLIDTIHYNRNQNIKNYIGVEPRLSIGYSINPTMSVKAGYNRMYQYLHLISNTTAITPIDIWQPSGYYFKPQKADQISLGVFKDFKEKAYSGFAELFYKKIDNVLDFKDGAQLILNNHLETDLLQGKARAYGIETSLTKLTGRMTGSLNYTYSRSLRTIKGDTEEESINKGKEYASNFDQPHIINLSWRYSMTRRFHFTGGFTYHTGRPVTAPVSGFLVDNITVANFSERNEYRIPDYHRLDLALIIEGSHKKKKIWDGTWAISVYNVYARKNPYTVFFKDAGNGSLRPYQLSIIGTILPSLSYSFKF